MMEKENITVLSYGHENSVGDPYTLESLNIEGDSFEVDVPVENIAMALCAHHKAVEIQREDPNTAVKIITVGGCAESNMKIVQRINEITGDYVDVEANKGSESTATNIKSLKEYESPFIIFCQRFAKLRARIHSKYHLKDMEYTVLDWESFSEQANFSDSESKLLSEVKERHNIPLTRRLVEAVLVVFAIIDPADGLTTKIAGLRKREREKNPHDNPFNKIGLE